MNEARPAVAGFRLALVVALAGVPAAARPTSLTITDTLVSISECQDSANQGVSLSWDLGSSSGDHLEVLASNTSGCSTDSSSSSVTTGVLVDSLSTPRTSYPSSGESLTLDSVLTAAGKAGGSCDGGADYRVYVCVKLYDSGGSVVTSASSSIKLQLTRPPAPVDIYLARPPAPPVARLDAGAP